MGISSFKIQAKYDENHNNNIINMETKKKNEDKNIILKNKYVEWQFDVNGNLISINKKPTSMMFMQYPTDTTTNLKGDAYQWRPMEKASNIILCEKPSFINYCNTGNITSKLILHYEKECVNGTEINITFTLNKIGPIEEQIEMSVDVEVGPIIHTNSEVAIRIQSSIVNENGHFYTDEGGFQHRVRIFNANKDKDTLNNIASNFFPIVSSAYIRDENGVNQLTIFTQHSHGFTSSKTGEMEIMLHRRISNGFINLENVNKSISNLKIVSSTVEQYENIRNYITQYIEHPPFSFFHFNSIASSSSSSSSGGGDGGGDETKIRKEYIPIPSNLELPMNIHLMTLEIGMNDANEGGRVIRLRLINLLEPTTSSKNKNMNMPVTVNVTNVMKNIFTIKKWQERTLTGSMEMSYAKSTRLHWDNNEKIFNNYKYDPSISNHKEDWSTGNVVVSIKPLDIVTLHLVT